MQPREPALRKEKTNVDCTAKTRGYRSSSEHIYIYTGHRLHCLIATSSYITTVVIYITVTIALIKMWQISTTGGNDNCNQFTTMLR